MTDLIRKPASATLGGELSDSSQVIPGDKTFNGTLNFPNGINLDPTTMTNAQATKLGFMQYVIGTSYTNGTPTLSSTVAVDTLYRSVLIPYQTLDGKWRLKGNLAWTTGVNSSQMTLTLSGITFANTPGAETGGGGGSSLSFAGVCGITAKTNTGDMYFRCSQSDSSFRVFFEAELESKPTWAY